MTETNGRAAKIAAIREAAKAKLAAETAPAQSLDEAFSEVDPAVDVETFIAEHGLEGNQ